MGLGLHGADVQGRQSGRAGVHAGEHRVEDLGGSVDRAQGRGIVPLGESQGECPHECENQVGRQGELGVEPPAPGCAQVLGDVHDDGEADGAHGGAQDDGDEHPPVGDVGGEAFGEDDEACVVEHGDRHEDGVPHGADGVDAHRQEAREEYGGQEGLHGQ